MTHCHACRLMVPESVMLNSQSLTGLAPAAPAALHTETGQAVVAQQQAGLLPSVHDAPVSQQQTGQLPMTHGAPLSQQQTGQLPSMRGAPPGQQLHECQLPASQAPAGCTGFQGSGSDAAARLAPGPCSIALLQAQPASTLASQPGHTSVQSMRVGRQPGPALQQVLPEQPMGQACGASRRFSAAAQHMQAASSVDPGSQARASVGQSTSGLHHPALQRQENALPTSSLAKPGWQAKPQLGCTQPGSAALTTNTVASSRAGLPDAQPLETEAASGVKATGHADAAELQVAVQPTALLCKARQASSHSAPKESDAVPTSQFPPDAQCQVKASSQGLAAMQSFVPQALHHLASKCSSQQAGDKAQSGTGAQPDRSVQVVAVAMVDNIAQIDRPTQSDKPAQPDSSAQAEKAAQADKPAQARAHPYGIRSSRRAAGSSKPATSSSADMQKPPTGAHQPSTDSAPEHSSTASPSQQHSMLSQQRQQLNAILNSLQLPGVDSLELSSSEDLSFGDIPSEDDCDSADSSSGTAVDSSGGASSQDDSSREDSGRDNDSEYRPGGQRASRKKRGKARERKNKDGKRVSGRRKGNRHITMKFLEEGGYFDAPIQVCCLITPVVTISYVCVQA